MLAVDDLDGLADDLDRAAERLGQDAHGLVHASTLRTESLGKANAPVRTGFLRGSVTSEFDGGPGSDTISGETGPEADYARFVHNGTSRQSPNPFMDRAADVVEPMFYAGADAIAGRVLDG